ncbi:MAG TPA: flagellar biosynthesis protein FlhA [Planctomycetota bacterium]|nr:flagellar biosynthesis protein FlhA [Planctomycetota bacterium]
MAERSALGPRRALDILAGNRDATMIFLGIMLVFIPLIMPLPPLVMDMLLVIDITAAVLVLMSTVYMTDPLQLSSFPSLLLILTFYRLALNVATSRLILGSPEQTEAKAGQMVKAFGEIVAGGNVVVGAVIFLILVIIQFVVITKGATRISEVAARFVLDAMPGKQMSIDADLNAGLINEAEARRRREKITREADFYGAMDGASKWVRGDAIASLIITMVNILGGFIIGVAMHGLSWGEALRIYSILTIGDGLVNQVPALIMAVSAGLVTTRSASSDMNLGGEVVGQLFSRPRALATAAAILAVLSLIVFPTVRTFPIALLLGFVAWQVQKVKVRQEKAAERAAVERSQAEVKPERVEGLLKVDPMELEVGYGLIPLVDPAQGGELLERVTMIRRQIAMDLGLVVPPVRIRDNMQLEPGEYCVKLRGTEVARGTALADRLLAMDSGVATGKVEGIETKEPAFGMPAVWITRAQKDRASAMGYTVVDAESVVATHLTEVIRRHASEILTREQVTKLLENLKESSARLVEEVYPKLLSTGEIQKVLQNLLRERVSIRSLEVILEALGDCAPRTKDPEILTEYARNALGRAICRSLAEPDGKLHVVSVDPKLEDAIDRAIQRTETGSYMTMPPADIRKVVEAVGREVGRLASAGHSGVVLCSPQVRAHLKRLTEAELPSLAVISYNELVPEVQVESLGMVAVEGVAVG